MKVETKYPDGEWETSNDQRCPNCGQPILVYAVEEPHPHGGEMIKYNKAEKCEHCRWKVRTD